MSLVETGFKTYYEVKKIRSIKARVSGEVEGNKYGSAVKLKSLNIEQVDDEKLGLVEKEVILEVTIPCDDKILKKFNLYLRDLQKSNKPFSFIGTLPRMAGKDTYTVTSSHTAEEIMKGL